MDGWTPTGLQEVATCVDVTVREARQEAATASEPEATDLGIRHPLYKLGTAGPSPAVPRESNP